MEYKLRNGRQYRSNDGITTALLWKDTAEFKVRKCLLMLNVIRGRKWN